MRVLAAASHLAGERLRLSPLVRMLRACARKGASVRVADGKWWVLVPIVCVGIAGCSSSHPKAAAQPGSTRAGSVPSAASVPAAAAPVTMSDGQRITSALTGTPSATGVPVFLAGIDPRQAQLPAGSHLSLDVEQAVVTGNTARVPATVTGPLAGPWTVLLERIDGTWRVYGAVKS